MSEKALTCRFCYDEGTEAEPLFYPCKCTGSIKYIHKGCLDEWLKHNKQEKCGICKEKYAYKTIYDENMPRYMPIVDTVKLFYRQVLPSTKKTANSIFVCAMWLVVFPYTVHLNLSLLAFICRYVFGTTEHSVNSNATDGSNGLLKLVVNVNLQALNCYLPTFFGLVAIPCAIRVYKLVDKRYEETINKEAARIRAKQEQDVAMFNQAVRELMPLGDLANNNENRAQGLNELMQELNEAIERLQEIQEMVEVEARHFGLISARWLRTIGLLGISKKVVKFYITQLAKVHLAMLLLYWAPLIAGLTIAYAGLNILVYTFDTGKAVYSSKIQHGFEFLIKIALGLVGLTMAACLKRNHDISALLQLLFIIPFCIKNAEVYNLLVLALNNITDITWVFSTGPNISEFLYTKARSALAENHAYSLQVVIFVGYVWLLSTFWGMSSMAKRYVKPEYGKPVWVCRGFVNYILVGMLLIFATIAILGLMVTLPFAMMIKPGCLTILFSYFKSNFWTTAFAFWFAGQIASFIFFISARIWSKHTRPGFLWYVNAGGNDATISKIIFKHSVGKYIFTMVKSALHMLAISILIINVPLLILQRLSLLSLADLSISGNTFEFAIGCIFAIMLWNSKFISRWFTTVFRYSSFRVSQYLRMTEYVTGEHSIVDEGQWTFKGIKWLYIPFGRYFMPNHIVENAFKHVSERFSDRARVGKKSKSLSTKKYYARIQQAIDNSLAETCLAFTLKPNNVRVPGVSSVNILKNRKYMVPLNDDGLPVDSMDDYEAADHPERRKWAESRGMAIPPSAVDEDDGKYIFKKSDYSTVYLPPMIELRETLYFSILIGVFSTMAFVALLCIWNIGYFILKWLHINNISVVVLLFTGYLTTLLGALFAVSVVKLWHGSSPMANVTVGGQVIKSTFNAVCKAASIAIVFGVFLPTLLGMVKEMYISVPYYHYYSSGYPQYSTETSLLQFAFRIWKCNVILAIAGSFSLFLATDNEWLDDVYEGIYRRDSLRQVWRLIKRRAIPAAVRLAVIYLLPIVLATVNMKLDNSLTSDAFRRLLLLKDVHVLAPLVRISMLSCTAVLFVTKVAMTYRNCVHMIRDKLYAVGQVLENVDGSSTPHFRPSEPTTPTTI